MSLDFSNDNIDFDNGEIEELLAKAQEESLRYYNEVELTRLQKENVPEEKDKVENVLSTQVGGKAGTLLYTGVDAAGFHLDAGKSYIYPTNYPVRQYQAAMVKTALFKNTMVSLPTGLGKTFIAAVVMYNFYRWYPNGKVVFMAPTRPLVAQQTKACHHIMNIPVEHTAELTGMQNAELRVNLWKEKRVFYLTPQVMVNDLKSKTCPASLIKCIVIDEAHRATKDYAYCQVLKLLSEEDEAIFRVLGLSATPGNDINAVQQVVKNLGISALEMRSEDSLDVAPYTHSRTVDKIVVELSGNILRVKEDLLQVYEKYAKRLKDVKALSNNIAMVSKFQILKACEKFRANPPRGMPPAVIGNFISDFTVCMSLAHSLELLQTYGLRAFYTYLADENSEKTKAAATRLRKDDDLTEMLKRLHGCLFPRPCNESSYTWSHPKLKNLVTVLTEHFQQNQSEGSTKAIVFCQYRVVVSEIVELLSKFKPLVKATEFIGQSGGKEKGMPQAKQLQIMKDFRNSIVNVLVATCVAEEGLDIGEVDLIILMESHKSPVRLVQRIGRTGRKRKGRCIVLLTKGREEQKFHEAMATRKSYVENIMKSAAVKASLCQSSPRMIPVEFNPVQQLVHINATNLESPARPQIKKQSDIRKCFTAADCPVLSNGELSKVLDELGGHPLSFNTLPKNEEIWHRRFDKKVSIDELLSKSQTKLAEWNEWNHEEHETYYVDHTSDSKFLCHVLKLSSKEIDGINFEQLLKAGVTCSKSDDAINNLEEKHSSPNKRKKMKKDTVKKNLGMDIRQCLAFAVEKSSAPPQKQIIELSSDEEIDSVDFLAPAVNTEICHIKDSRRDILCELFISGSYPFNLLNRFIPAVSYASKAWACERTLPKLDIFFRTLTIDVIKNLKIGETSPEKTAEPKIIKNPEKVIISNDFVEIDDLFDTESDKDDHAANSNLLNTAIFEFHDNVFDLNDLDNQKRPQKHTKSDLDTSCNANNSRILNSSNLMNVSFNTNNDIALRVSSPLCLNTSQANSHEKPIWSDSSAKKQSKSELITITSLMNRPYYLSPTSNRSASKENLNCMASSTPIPSVKNFTKSQILVKSSSQFLNPINKIITENKSPRSDTSEMWNLSDLFEEEELKNGLEGKNKLISGLKSENEDISCHPGNDLQNSTMLGITQMVSLIEKEKRDLKKLCDSDIVKKTNDDSFSYTEKCDEQNRNNLSDYLDSDVDIFTEVNDELVVPKHSQGSFNDPEKIEQSRNAIQDFPSLSSECKASSNSKELVTSKHSQSLINDSEKDKRSYSKINEFPSLSSECKTLSNAKEIELSNSIDDFVDKINTQNSQNRCAVKNFKKFTAKKALFLSCGKSSQNVASANKKNGFPPVSENLDNLTNKLWKPFIGDVSNDSVKPRVSKSVSMFNEFKSDKNHTTLSESSTKRITKSPLLINGKKVDSISVVDVTKETKKSFENMQLNNVNIPRSSESIFQENKSKSQPCSFKKPIWNFSDSDDSDVFEVPSLKNKISLSEEKEECLKIRKQKHKHKKKSNEFIDQEAEVSGTKFSSDDTDGSSLDDIDNSFINDNTELISNDTQAIYLKSVKSPLNKGNFKIPTNQKYLVDVYSQQVEQDSEYVNDSFCVDSAEEDEDQSTNSLSFLEIAERKLAKSKRKIPPKKKRRRILNASQENSSPENTNLISVTMSQPSPKNSLNIRKRRLIQSESEAEESPLRKKLLALPDLEKNTDLGQHSTVIKKEKGKVCNVLFTLSSDEENPDRKEEKVIDLTLSSNEDENSESELERKFQEDLKEAIIRSQSDFIRSRSSQGALSESSRTSTPKTNKKTLDLDKLDRSVRNLNQKFSERLSKIRSKFCSSDED